MQVMAILVPKKSRFNRFFQQIKNGMVLYATPSHLPEQIGLVK